MNHQRKEYLETELLGTIYGTKLSFKKVFTIVKELRICWLTSNLNWVKEDDSMLDKEERTKEILRLVKELRQVSEATF